MPRSAAPSRTGSSQSRSNRPSSGSHVDQTDSPTRITEKPAARHQVEVGADVRLPLVLRVVGGAESDRRIRHDLLSIGAAIPEVGEGHRALGGVQPDHAAGEGGARLGRPVAAVEFGEQRAGGQQPDAIATPGRRTEPALRRDHLDAELDVAHRDVRRPGLRDAGQVGPGGDVRAVRLESDPVPFVVPEGEATGAGGARRPCSTRWR